jgi:hypothetical protein
MLIRLAEQLVVMLTKQLIIIVIMLAIKPTASKSTIGSFLALIITKAASVTRFALILIVRAFFVVIGTVLVITSLIAFFVITIRFIVK